MKISIIGAAGTMGSCTAYALASQGLADEIVLMDLASDLVRGHSMDIRAATVGHYTMSVRVGDIEEDLGGSDVVIVTAGLHFGLDRHLADIISANIPIVESIVKRITTQCPNAVVIVATNPLDPLTYAACVMTMMDRKKFIGYNLNDSIRFRMIAAEVLDVGPNDIEGIVMGEHTGCLVPLFSSLKVDGESISIDNETKNQIRERLQNYLKTFVSLSKRTAGWTSASGIASIVKAVKDDTGQLFSCSTLLRGEYGFDRLSMGVPVLVGKEGIRKIPEWDLPGDEQSLLEQAADRISVSTEIADKAINKIRI